MAFCSAVYWSLPVPALTSSMSTLGYSSWKFSATVSRVGSHAQTVSSPPSSRTASMSTSAVSPPSPESSPEPHPVRARAALARAAVAMAPRRRPVRVMRVPLTSSRGCRWCGSFLHAPGGQSGLPEALHQQEGGDQRQDGQQRAGDHQVEDGFAAGGGGLGVP